ncbi:MAG: Fic family protein [Candidatus Micrarchaeota archaeon]
MKTKWDVLFALFELKKGGLAEIARKSGAHPSAAWQRLEALMKDGMAVRKDGVYEPNKGNAKTWEAFEIMKFCMGRRINYNLMLREEFAKVIAVASAKGEFVLGDLKGMNVKTARKYLSCLSRINLLLVLSKKPLRMKLVSDPVFAHVLAFFGMETGDQTERPEQRLGKESGRSVCRKLETGKRAEKRVSAEYGEIESLLAEIRRHRRDLPLADFEEEQKIEFTSASTQLEGNTFTLEESKELILHDIVPPDKKLKEANEVKNYFSAVNHLLAHLSEPMSIDYILDLHRMVVFNLGVREGIRAVNVSIKGNPFYKVAHFSEILPKLQGLCEKVNEFCSKKRGADETIEFATYVHNEFQHIHPFEDGNSRVTRLLWDYVLMRNGFPLINIYSNAKAEYLSLTKMARERDDGKLNAFLAGIIKDNLYRMARAVK